MSITPILPNVIEMEKAVLGAMLLKDGLVIPTVSGILKAEDFYREEHRVIYRTILKLYSENISPNILSLVDELKQSGYLEKIGVSIVVALADATFTTAFAEIYAQKIKEKSVLRNLIDAGNEISSEASKDAKPLDEILDNAEKKIFSITSKTAKSEFEKLDSILERSYQRIVTIANHPDDVHGVPSGFFSLDKVTNGFQKSDLILIAARPSMGKTAFALNIAVNAAFENKKVAIFSLEMSKEQIGHRILSSCSQIDSLKLTNGTVSDEELLHLVNTLNNVSARANIFIDDTAGITVMELRSKARRLKTSQGLDIVLIDYLQLMQGSVSRASLESNRQQEISEISRSLKALARELNVPIIALSQLSRNVELRAEKRPQLSDLRESGSLEQDADIVMFLYREEYYNRESENNESAELIIAKNRNGPTTNIQLNFKKEYMKFSPVTYEEKK